MYERVDITYLAKGDDQKIVVRAVAASRVVRVEGKLKYSLFEAFGDFGRAWGRLAIVSVKGEE